jgi:MFS family permease
MLLAGWLTPLLLAISVAPTRGWLSVPVAGLVGSAVVVCGVWAAVQRRSAYPLIDPVTLALPTVRATNIATLLLGFGMFGSWMLVPLLVAQPAASGIGFGASPSLVGLVMLPTALGNLLVMPLGRWLSHRRGPRVTLLCGTATAGAAYLLLALAHGSLAEVGIAVLGMGAGVGLAFAAVATLIVEAVPQEETAVAAGVNNVMRTTGGSLGATLGGSLLTWSVAASGLPTAGAYTAALLLYAAALVAAFACTLRIPRTTTDSVGTTLTPAPAAARSTRG